MCVLHLCWISMVFISMFVMARSVFVSVVLSTLQDFWNMHLRTFSKLNFIPYPGSGRTDLHVLQYVFENFVQVQNFCSTLQVVVDELICKYSFANENFWLSMHSRPLSKLNFIPWSCWCPCKMQWHGLVLSFISNTQVVAEEHLCTYSFANEIFWFDCKKATKLACTKMAL